MKNLRWVLMTVTLILFGCSTIRVTVTTVVEDKFSDAGLRYVVVDMGEPITKVEVPVSRTLYPNLSIGDSITVSCKQVQQYWDCEVVG